MVQFNQAILQNLHLINSHVKIGMNGLKFTLQPLEYANLGVAQGIFQPLL